MSTTISEIINRLTKDETFVLRMQKLIQVETIEMIKHYKWLFSLIFAILIAASSFFGFKLYSISVLKQELEVIQLDAQNILQDINTKAKEILSKSEVINKSISESESKADKAISFVDRELASIDKRINQSNQLDLAYKDVYEANSDLMKQERESFKSEISGLLKKYSLKEKEFEDSISDAREVTELSRSLLAEWNKRKDELILLSSSVSVYVERCSNREPEEEKPLHDYKPSYVNLPFSDKSMVVVFNEYRIRKATDPVNGKPVKYKEIELYITVRDENGNTIYKSPLVLQEKQYRERQNLAIVSIPSTQHLIQAEFIYLPPNPLMRIPDFAILTVSIDPEKFLASL